MTLKIEQTDAGHLRVEASPETVELIATENAYQATFGAGSNRIQLQLTAEQLKLLGLQCLAFMPEIEPRLSVSSPAEAYRLPAQGLLELDDRDIQFLLRECQAECLIDFLWYMKNADLLRKFMRNLSQRAAEMIMEDLECRWYRHDPDTAPEKHRQRGQSAVLMVLGVAHQLAQSGQIEPLPDYGPANEAQLGAEEVAALLLGESRDE